jgi:hypothetical protein
MPTPTGTISLNDVNIELGRSSGANINMNDSAVRTLAGVGGSGTIITMDNLRGKSSGGTFSPDGGTSSGSRVTLSDYRAFGTASVTVTCTQSATWTYAFVTGIFGSANVASGGTGTTITFSMAKGVNYRYSEWTLNATSGSTTRYYTIILETEGNE